MTGKERISNILKRKPVDRIGLYEHFWQDTRVLYTKQGHIKPDENLDEHFGFDLSLCWAFNKMLDLDFTPVVVSEDETTITTKDGNGATLRRFKDHVTTPENVDYDIKERSDWEKAKHFLLNDIERRINFEMYRNAKAAADKAGRFFAWSGPHLFEDILFICGHVNMLYGMADDPDWFIDMAQTYAELTIKMQEILFEREGYPDGLFYYEDLGYKGKTFTSPKMYRELLFPVHKYTFDWAHERGLPIILHSCGYVETLIPDLIEAGVDCLQTLEVKAGMDVVKLHKEFGDRLSFMGGIDVRALYTNDGKTIDEELNRVIPIVKQGYGFIAHSDHSIPYTVEYDSLKYYFDKVLELGRY
ncbi:MAG: hypothetical protein FWD44_06310 [Oscillospiraceae bacterium]|nr:hypothetical protein [Oscillospiraceae bacterium]